ncbi:MAG: hypothetical protein VX768_01045 [Planctomycetota bacterium]|nr:hypothetical protein [Planctomycetota bacterium]
MRVQLPGETMPAPSTSTLLLLLVASLPATLAVNRTAFTADDPSRPDSPRPGLHRPGLPPVIRFDIPAAVAAREVTSESFAKTHSLEKLLEVRFTASTLLDSGSDRVIQELFFLIEAPEKSMRMVDFSPSTTLTTEFASPIDVSENRDTANNSGIQLTPAVEMFGKANLNAGFSNRRGETRKVSRLPPKQLAVASGTQNRQTATYFKFKPSSQSTLEGSRELCLIIQVPIAWRADLLHVSCRGITSDTGGAGGRVSRSDFVVPVYLAPDAPARILCDQFIAAESQLRRAADDVVSVQQQSKKNVVSQVSSFLHREILKKKKNPARTTGSRWLEEVLFGTISGSEVESKFNIRLSERTRRAVDRYQKCREKLTGLKH